MKELVICTDLYETSDYKIKIAMDLASKINLKPTIFHIDTIAPQIEKTFHTRGMDTEYKLEPIWGKEIEAIVLQRIEKQLSRLNIKKEEINFENFEGSINEGVEHLKTHENAEFILIGASHHSGLHRLFFNTLAEKIFFHAKKDTMIVRDGSKAMNKIYYIMSTLDHDKKDLNKVINFSKMLNLDIHLECIVPNYSGEFDSTNHEEDSNDMALRNISSHHREADDLLIETKKIITSHGIKCDHSINLVLNNSPGETLVKMMEENEFDLVMIHPHHKIFEHLSLGSATLDIIREVKSNFYLLNEN